MFVEHLPTANLQVAHCNGERIRTPNQFPQCLLETGRAFEIVQNKLHCGLGPEQIKWLCKDTRPPNYCCLPLCDCDSRASIDG